MTLIADGLLIAAALVAAIYCHVLSRRLRKLRELDNGLGGAIAALSRQVEEMRAALDSAKRFSGESVRDLAARTARAEVAAGRLELLLATLHERDDATPLRRPPARTDASRTAPSDPRSSSETAAVAERERPESEEAEDPQQVVASLREEIARAMRAVAGER